MSNLKTLKIGVEFILEATSFTYSKNIEKSDPSIQWTITPEGGSPETIGTGKAIRYKITNKYAGKKVTFRAFIKDDSKAKYPLQCLTCFIEEELSTKGILIQKVSEATNRTTAKVGDTVEYKVTKYNTANVSAAQKKMIKWDIKLGDEGKKLFVNSNNDPFRGETIHFIIPSSWAGKNVILMPYMNQSTEKISTSVNVTAQNIFLPIVIDRYKMPGLNPQGTDIADDMTYGYGVPSNDKSVYTPKDVEAYKQRYANTGFILTRDAIFANKGEYDKNKDSFEFPNNTKKIGLGQIEESIKKVEQQKKAKAIYSEKQCYSTKYLFIPTGWDVQCFNSRSTYSLFQTFKDKAKFCYAQGDLESNIEKMIEKMQRNEGGIYEDRALTEAIKKRPKTHEYCKNIEKYIAEQLKLNKGDVSKLEDKQPYFDDDDSQGRRALRGKSHFTRPAYNTWADRIVGTTIATNDIWATEVHIADYKLTGSNYTLKYAVTLWDHFGLDKPDMEKLPNIIPIGGEPFVCWFILQHLRGYRPFLTKIGFEREYRGNLNRGKKEIEADEKNAKEQELVEQTEAWLLTNKL